MGNPSNSSGNSKNESTKITLEAKISIGVFILVVIGCLVLLWENRSYDVYSKTQTEIKTDNGITITNLTSTVFIQNYFPFYQTRIKSKILNITDGKIVDSIENDQERLEEANIKIYSYSFKMEYGGKELIPLYKRNDPTQFPSLRSFSMSNTTVIVKWSYNMSEPSPGQDPYHVILMLEAGKGWLPSGIHPLLWSILFYLIFVVSGLIVSRIVFEKGKVSEDYGILTKFTNKGWEDARDEKTEKSYREGLQRIIDFPSKKNSFPKAIFGLGIFIFKSIINSTCKKHHENLNSYKITPYKKEALKKIFAKYSKQSFKEIKDMLPELKAIIVGVLFLVSVGISFNWKLGAAAPLVASVGIAYFFVNIGSLFYFVKKSTKDAIWITLAFFAGILVVSFPSLIEILRYLG